MAFPDTQPSPTEEADRAAIVHGILAIQAKLAARQHRPLGRGTHTKGVCVRGQFEIFDLASRGLEPAMAARLAQGIYAHPGVYQATVRFANARSLLARDAKKDVRAMSFAVQFPAGVLGAGASRVDYSMNNGTTFPINDAHAFATLMSVVSARGLWGKVRTLARLSFADLRGLLRTAIQGVRSERNPVRPYQQMRYWSTVPFRHGAGDAVKYSASPAADNPAASLSGGVNELRDEIVRHVDNDARMSSFDIGLQFLDTARMTYKGEAQDAAFWIDNASVEWNEQEAPFHVVGRLTLEPKSALSAESCEAMYIDVTGHAAQGAEPLGSINRARHDAELASRNARFAAATAPESAIPRGILAATGAFARAAAIVIALGALLGAALTYGLTNYPYSQLPPVERVDEVIYPDQGWGAGLEAPGRQVYYYTAQGAGLKDLRYSWFVNLEMPFGKTRFANPDYLRRQGFIVDPQTAANPDQLPVGFTRHFDNGLHEELLDITCSACHTGQLNLTRGGRTVAVRIDGGQAMHALTTSTPGHFLPTMMASMVSTWANPFKFNRFARRVLGDSPGGRWELHRQLGEVIGNFVALAFHEKWYHLTPTEEGFGRTDALARIANTVFGDNLTTKNFAVGNAPVSYPAVWNIWKFDWVQYNASVSQPMARNIGEAMGVGAKYTLIDRYGKPLPAEQRYRSTALIENLHTIELALRKLQPPSWPQAFGPVDQAKAARGKELFNQHCVSCHGPHVAPPDLKARNAPLKTASDPEWVMKTLCVDDIGTDPNAARNFWGATIDMTLTGMTADELRSVARRNIEPFKQRQREYLNAEIARLKAPGADGYGTYGVESTGSAADQIRQLEQQLSGLDGRFEQELSQLDPKRISVGAALSYLGTMIREKAYDDLHYTKEQRADRDGFGMLDMPQVLDAYKPRPLAGIWATPPYLHNGSVPTLYALLSPASERPKTFLIANREFDPEQVGLAQQTGTGFTYDTTLPGNHNTGHEFNSGYVEWKPGAPPAKGLIGPLLSREDRLAIIEHLKVRNDDVDGPQEPSVPHSETCQPQGAWAK